jgi:hypothetical protein
MSFWTCNICSMVMPVAYGPYHLVGDEHIERLTASISGISLNQPNSVTIGSPVTQNSNEDGEVQPRRRKSHRSQSLRGTGSIKSSTPLDRFFLSFPAFNYDPSLPPATSYKCLQKQQRWHRNDPASEEGWDRYQNALTEEFQLWFGAEDDLEAWHALCRAIGIDPPPVTCKLCKAVRFFRKYFRLV